MTHLRYVAVGDSLTEGKGDVHPDGSPRGFADLLAAALAAATPGAAYANLARPSVRAAEIARDQVPALGGLRPDLVTVIGGINDAIALRFPARRVRADITELLRRTRRHAPDATILAATLPDIADLSAVARLWRTRVAVLNEAVCDVAPALGITVVDLGAGPPITREDLALDRVHPSPLGHLRFARLLAAPLGLHVPLPAHLAARPRAEALQRIYRTAVVAPRFVSRRVARGRLIASQPPKRPDLTAA